MAHQFLKSEADYLFWIGMLVSSKTPRDVVDKINQVTLKALQSPEVRERLTAPTLHADQGLYTSEPLRMTGRIMAKDEDVCLHCGLCAERCPTGAWDMQKYLVKMTHAGPGCRKPQRKAA